MTDRGRQAPNDNLIADPYASMQPPGRGWQHPAADPQPEATSNAEASASVTKRRRRLPRWASWLTLLSTVAVVGAVVGAAATLSFDLPFVVARAEKHALQQPTEAQPRTPLPRGDLTGSEKRNVTLFKQAAPSVVYITKFQRRRSAFRLDATTIPAGTGSGFVWDDQGHIVTNYHVIAGGSGARVTLSDRSTWDAELVGHAVDKDLAVLRIKAPSDKLKPIAVGTSHDLEVGQHVLAIGNPFGLDHTLSTGVISGLGREIKSLAKQPISGVIQTDAAINPGNSGGPLLDSSGRLIGVNTAIFSPSGASAGIGFAVPVDTVSRIVPELITHGRRVKPGLGIEIADVGLARRLNVEGVLVMNVLPDSGADKAGMRATRRDGRSGDILLGDVIVALDGETIREPADIYRALEKRKVGDKVSVKVRRGDRDLTLEIELIDLSAPKP